jgi:glucose-1-phosphate adenylyltransferase
MGIYLFKRDILEEELIDDARKDTSHDFGKDIIPQMLKKGRRVFAYHFQDENKKESLYWRDIGTLDAYYEANMDLVEVTPIFNLYDKAWPIRPGFWRLHRLRGPRPAVDLISQRTRQQLQRSP